MHLWNRERCVGVYEVMGLVGFKHTCFPLYYHMDFQGEHKANAGQLRKEEVKIKVY